MATRNKKWRRVYPYICAGCRRRRIAFVYERAKRQMCLCCERDKVDPNQGQLFPDDECGECGGQGVVPENVDDGEGHTEQGVGSRPCICRSNGEI